MNYNISFTITSNSRMLEVHEINY